MATTPSTEPYSWATPWPTATFTSGTCTQSPTVATGRWTRAASGRHQSRCATPARHYARSPASTPPSAGTRCSHATTPPRTNLDTPCLDRPSLPAAQRTRRPSPPAAERPRRGPEAHAIPPCSSNWPLLRSAAPPCATPSCNTAQSATAMARSWSTCTGAHPNPAAANSPSWPPQLSSSVAATRRGRGTSSAIRTTPVGTQTRKAHLFRHHDALRPSPSPRSGERHQRSPQRRRPALAT